MSKQEIQEFEVMAQMVEDQARRLRELELRLQMEQQAKANLEMDFHHLLDQLTGLAHLTYHDEHAVVCG